MNCDSNITLLPPCNITMSTFEGVLNTSTISFQAVIVFLIFAGNTLVAVAFIRTPSLRTFTNILVLSLTAADFVSGLGAIVVLIDLTTWRGTAKPKILCRLKYVPVIIWWLSGLHSILAMTLDRYLGIVKPLDYPRLVTKNRILVCLAILWMYSLTGGVLAFVFSESNCCANHVKVIVICDLTYVFPKQVFFYCTINLALVSIVYIFCYGQIYMVAKAQSAKIAAARGSVQSTSMNAPRPGRALLKKDKKYVISILLVLILFLGCWIPVIVLLVVENSREELSHDKMKVGVYRLGASFLCQISSVLNPLVFTWRQPDFFSALKNIFGFPPAKEENY